MLHEKQDPDSTGSVWINPLFADQAFSDVPKHALGTVRCRPPPPPRSWPTS